MDCEILISEDYSARGAKMIHAMIEAAPAWITVKVSRRWTGSAPWLMTYGLGHMVRHQWTDEHRRRGGRLIGWDLGYWGRDVPVDFAMRLTIDADHPHAMIGPEDGARFDATGITLREDADLNGPIILVGLTNKQRRWKGLRTHAWERAKVLDLQARFPGREILFRPKKREEAPCGLKVIGGTIEHALKGASLVVCSHSNVAVDACIAGVPVECEDGAALALYQRGSAPSADERLAFLRSLAHWQYTPREAPLAWEFIRAKMT